MGEGDDIPQAPTPAMPSPSATDPASPFAPPVKRSITIAGHQTAISLEPIFWDALRAAATRGDIPLNALVARIDLARMQAENPPNLASAIRCWLFQRHHASDE